MSSLMFPSSEPCPARVGEAASLPVTTAEERGGTERSGAGAQSPAPFPPIWTKGQLCHYDLLQIQNMWLNLHLVHR